MKLFRLALKALVALVLLLIVLVLVGPFLVPVSPLEGLAQARALAGANDRFVTIPFAGTDGIDIRYIEAGTAGDQTSATFVLLHGSLLSAGSWQLVMDAFAARGRTIAYDQPPYGLSEKLLPEDWNDANPYAPQAAVAQLFAVIDALDLSNVVLVGNSYGGRLAVDAALARPDAVSALVLVDAAVYAGAEMPGWLLGLPQVSHLGPLLARWLGDNRDFYRSMYADPQRIDAARLDTTFAATGAENWDYGLWHYLEAWSTPDISDRLDGVDLPALVVTGDSDTIVPVADSERLAAALPNAEYAVLPDCGHLPQEECPNALMQAVTDWLDRR